MIGEVGKLIFANKLNKFRLVITEVSQHNSFIIIAVILIDFHLKFNDFTVDIDELHL